MPQFEVRFDCGDDYRSPAWVVVRFEGLGSEAARYGQTVAEFASFAAAEQAAVQWNRSIKDAKFTINSQSVAV